MVNDSEDITDLSKDEFAGSLMVLARHVPEIYNRLSIMDVLSLYYSNFSWSIHIQRTIDHINQIDYREVLTPWNAYAK